MSQSIEEAIEKIKKNFTETRSKYPDEYHFWLLPFFTSIKLAYERQDDSCFMEATFFTGVINHFYDKKHSYDFKIPQTRVFFDYLRACFKLCDFIFNEKEHFKGNQVLDSEEFDSYIKTMILAEQDIQTSVR